MNVIQLLYASTSAHIFSKLKNVSVFPRVNVDVRRTSDQRQLSNVRHSDIKSHIHGAQSTHEKNKNNNLSPDCERRSKLAANAQRVSNKRANQQRYANALNA